MRLVASWKESSTQDKLMVALHAMAGVLVGLACAVLVLFHQGNLRGQEINKFNQERLNASKQQMAEIAKIREQVTNSQSVAVALIEQAKADQARSAAEQTKLLTTIVRQLNVTQQMALNAANVARHAEQRVDRVAGPDISGEIRKK